MHPNRLPFTGKLVPVDVLSDSVPTGARGHRVVMPKAVAEAALPSLLGMAVNFAATWDRHLPRQKCGVITHAAVVDGFVVVTGYTYAKDFPEIQREANAAGAELGMSFEISNAYVENLYAEVWRLTRATFTGAAILQRHRAAYRTTAFAVSDTVLDESGLSISGYEHPWRRDA